MRYGTRLDSNIFLRVYAQRLDQNSTKLSLIAADTIGNAWNSTQGGFRMDYYPSGANTLTLQGDFYGGDANSNTKRSVTDGQNVLTRFTHVFSDKSNLIAQLYFDRNWRTTPNTKASFFYELNTYDLDVQHRFPLGNRQSILWGLGYRLRQDKTARSFVPLSRDMPLYSGFVQDEIELFPNKLKLTIGSKILHNVFTGFEIQPSTRLAWTPAEGHTIWAAASRAVRTPSRFDADLLAPRGFKSEKVNAYELGYRVRPVDQLLLSFSTFYNHYDDLRSIDSANTDTDPQLEVILANSQLAESWGFEFSSNFQLTESWRLHGGYTYFGNKISSTNPLVVAPISMILESVDPHHVFMFQSILDLPKNFQFDLMGRYVGELPRAGAINKVPAYFTMDARLGWLFKQFEFSIVGQNLLKEDNTETGLSRIPRSIYGKFACRF